MVINRQIMTKKLAEVARAAKRGANDEQRTNGSGTLNVPVHLHLCCSFPGSLEIGGYSGGQSASSTSFGVKFFNASCGTELCARSQAE
jgi:hypothetical protein